MTLDWTTEDRWVSNYGRGPYVARILCATDKSIKMERWLVKSRGRRAKIRFELPLKFFLASPSCGWTKQEKKWH